MTNKNKTHWLVSPNKNYLGHQDLPNGEDTILTIQEAKQEEVEIQGVIVNKKIVCEIKKVIRFAETEPWIKPMIVNQTNCKTIMKSHNVKYLEDSIGKKIKIGVDEISMFNKDTGKMEKTSCLRVRPILEADLYPELITDEQMQTLQELIDKIPDLDKERFCKLLNINAVNQLPQARFQSVIKRLNKKMKG